MSIGSSVLHNAMTVDVEDYFQVSAFERHIDRSTWENLPCRVERNLDLILELFHRHDVHATFFTLGWIAQRYPELIRRIVAAGHELASHGFNHGRAHDQTHDEFREDIRSAKGLLEDLSGVEVKGYRAPSFSIGHMNLWALECLEAAGYAYSSSIYPIQHDHYGMPDAPRFKHTPKNVSGLVEIPVTTVRVWNRNLPAGGGVIFDCCRMRCRLGACVACIAKTANPAYFIFIRGRSIPNSRVSAESGSRPDSGTT